MKAQRLAQQKNSKAQQLVQEQNITNWQQQQCVGPCTTEKARGSKNREIALLLPFATQVLNASMA